MYDKKYLEGGNVKKIETALDAAAILVAKCSCGNTHCQECPIRMYEEHKGSGCNTIVDEAMAFLAGDKVGMDNEEAIEAYNSLMSIVQHEEPKAEPENEDHGTCACCEYSVAHASGIHFCKAFFNFVHANGYCYRFKPGKEAAESDGV